MKAVGDIWNKQSQRKQVNDMDEITDNDEQFVKMLISLNTRVSMPVLDHSTNPTMTFLFITVQSNIPSPFITQDPYSTRPAQIWAWPSLLDTGL